MITSQSTSVIPSFDAPLATTAQGSLTNTGTTTGNFAVELQADTGEVGIASALVVPPGQRRSGRPSSTGP